MPEDISLRERLQAFLRAHPGAKRPEIREAFPDIPFTTLWSSLRDQTRRGELRRTGRPKAFKYYVAGEDSSTVVPVVTMEKMVRKGKMGRPRKDEGVPGNPVVDAAIAALELRREALSDAIHILRQLSKGNQER
jgi:hypothetical protein